MYAFYSTDFKKLSMFLDDQKISLVFASKRAVQSFKHSVKQSVEIMKSSEKTQRLSPVFEKLNNMFEP